MPEDQKEEAKDTEYLHDTIILDKAPEPVVEDAKPVGMATIVEMETPIDQFPAHQENV